MPLRATSTMIRTLDGLHLAGTVVTPEGTPERAVVLVHGGGVTREEGSFFTGSPRGLGRLALRRFGSICADAVRAKDAAIATDCHKAQAVWMS